MPACACRRPRRRWPGKKTRRLRRVRTVRRFAEPTGSRSTGAVRIERFGGNARFGYDRPGALAPRAEEAAAAPGMASDTLLIDQQQHGVAVAIEAQLAQPLDLP